MLFGASVDSPEALKAFKDKHNLGYSLLSDPKGTLAGTFGFAPRSRQTVVISKDGKVERIYSKAVPKEHPAEVLKNLGTPEK